MNMGEIYDEYCRKLVARLKHQGMLDDVVRELRNRELRDSKIRLESELLRLKSKTGDEK